MWRRRRSQPLLPDTLLSMLRFVFITLLCWRFAFTAAFQGSWLKKRIMTFQIVKPADCVDPCLRPLSCPQIWALILLQHRVKDAYLTPHSSSGSWKYDLHAEVPPSERREQQRTAAWPIPPGAGWSQSPGCRPGPAATERPAQRSSLRHTGMEAHRTISHWFITVFLTAVNYWRLLKIQK